jgi:hypothetical protein
MNQELIDLAREIAASEGIPLALALEIARKELGTVIDYARDWDAMVGQRSPAQPIYRVSAA